MQIRRYSDHPIVQKKVKEARAIFEKIDMSFIDNLPKKCSYIKLGYLTADEFDQWVIPGDMVGEIKV